MAGLIKTLSELEPESKPDEEVISKDETKLNSEDLQKLGADKPQQAYALKHQGWHVKDIASMFGVSIPTIYRWFKEYVEQQRAMMEKEPAINLILEEIAAYQEIERLCFYEIDQSEQYARDPESGDIIRVHSTEKKLLKSKFIHALLKTKGMKVDLCLQTGIFPKQPEKLYSALENEKRLDSGSDRDSKSREEILDDIFTLVSQSRSIR